ncbi:hypothetical protein FA13DRAFT_34479 [Coprinellus micaceus]|uniref:Superoxide dismutase [Cu-Zn] n=1 Tax=Coprinellus micaceus TaxID=71717 RepID=A0A4Y7U220_COPMI|nr:hypothetical protein FA13DRAFT_34479 [Coprinellus micaceus]
MSDPYGRQDKGQRPLFLSLIAFATSFLVVYALFFRDESTPVTHKAAVLLRGDSSVSGAVYFEQASRNGPVTVTGKLKGLDPGSPRGFHIHHSGDITNGCISTGSHYNPFGKNHGAPSDTERHVGDLGNVKVNEAGEANFSLEDSLLSLNGPRSIVGRAVVVHTGTDDLGRGGNEDSLKTGNAGGRAACGVIGIV